MARKEQERASRAGKKRDPSGRTDVLGHITPYDPAPFRRKKLNELMPMERVILRKLPKDRTDQEVVVIQVIIKSIQILYIQQIYRHTHVHTIFRCRSYQPKV